MKNARKELKSIIDSLDLEIVAANISYNSKKDKGWCYVSLQTGYDEKEYENFFNHLDFEYDDGYGYGSQEIDGTIWCKDGYWITRSEYNGSEWWEVLKYPKIPNELRRIDRERDQEIDKILK